MNEWGEQPGKRKYFGLTAGQFNLTFLAVVGSISIATLIYVGGIDAARDLLSDDPPASAVAAPTPASVSPQPAPADEPAGPAIAADGDGLIGDVFGTFDPLVVLNALGSGSPGPAQADPSGVSASLDASLLDERDLPPGFAPLGEMTFSFPDDELGSLEMVMRMFGTGDFEGGEPGTIVISAALAPPPNGTGGQLDGFDDLGDASPAAVDEIANSLEGTGIVLHDLRLLDSSGLGEGGVGIHMEMDFSGLFGAFPGLTDGNPFAGGIAWDMYVFVRGDRMLMLMVIWPPDLPSGVDARALAEIMDARTSQ